MRRDRYKIIFLIFFLNALNGISQERELNFMNIGNREGL